MRSIRQSIECMEAAGHSKTPIDNLVLRNLIDLAEGRKHEPDMDRNRRQAAERGQGRG